MRTKNLWSMQCSCKGHKISMTNSLLSYFPFPLQFEFKNVFKKLSSEYKLCSNLPFIITINPLQTIIINYIL
uniref:Uncharacterized protein n=1 Tax=Lepeophtheirus salmonis TaxID=72036 RepID=A0A0K2T8Q2_LEPSM